MRLRGLLAAYQWSVPRPRGPSENHLWLHWDRRRRPEILARDGKRRLPGDAVSTDSPANVKHLVSQERDGPARRVADLIAEPSAGQLLDHDYEGTAGEERPNLAVSIALDASASIAS